MTPSMSAPCATAALNRSPWNESFRILILDSQVRAARKATQSRRPTRCLPSLVSMGPRWRSGSASPIGLDQPVFTAYQVPEAPGLPGHV